MVNYLKTGFESLDTHTSGYPIGDLSMIEGELDGMLLKWSKSVTDKYNCIVASDYRHKNILKKQLEITDESINDEILHDTEIISDVVDKDTDVILFESDSIPKLHKFIQYAEDNEIAVIVVSNEPNIELLSSSAFIMHEMQIQNQENRTYKLVVKKDIYSGLSDDMIYDVTYNPYPKLEATERL